MIVMPVCCDNGGSLKVIGGARPATADPGTIWVNNANYNQAGIIIVGRTTNTRSISGHSGYDVILEVVNDNSINYQNYTEIVSGLRVRSPSLWLAFNNTIRKANAVTEWNIMTANGEWLYS